MNPLNLNHASSYVNTLVYNDLDQIKSSELSINTGSGSFSTKTEYEYDQGGRISREYFTAGGLRKAVCTYTDYNAWDSPKQKLLGGSLQTVDYSYLSNGFLDKINGGSVTSSFSHTSSAAYAQSSNSDLFAMDVDYDQVGNISSWKYQNRGYTAHTTYYTYDGLNRVKNANSLYGNQNETFTYRDLIGNIGAIQRHELIPQTDGSWSSRLVDNLTLNYSSSLGSRLSSVTDAAYGSAAARQYGYEPNSGNYTYDQDGNLTHDPQHGTDMSYNYMNLCRQVTKSDGSRLENVFDASGVKWQTKEYDASGNVQTRSYIDHMEFLDRELELAHHGSGAVRNLHAAHSGYKVLSGQATSHQRAMGISTSETLEMYQDLAYTAADYIVLSEGFEVPVGASFSADVSSLSTTPQYQWQYKIQDHLGDTRVLFADKNNNGTIDQTADPSTNEVLAFYNYSTFGLKVGGSHLNGGSDENRYTYNAKEEISYTGYQDYGARCYDATIGCFTTPDRFADLHTFQSVYGYAGGNPVSFIDVNGDSIRISVGNGNYAYYQNGSIYNRDGTQYTGEGTKTTKNGKVKYTGFLKSTVSALARIESGGTAGAELIGVLSASDKTITINQGKRNYAQGLNISFNPDSKTGGLDVNGNTSRPAFLGLAHELAHALDYEQDRAIDATTWFQIQRFSVLNAEKFGSNYENRIRAEQGFPLRSNYTTGDYGPGRLLNGTRAKYPTQFFPKVKPLDARAIKPINK